MKNFGDMMKQAAGLQQELEEVQQTIAGMEAEGEASAPPECKDVPRDIDIIQI